jgi:hypothetical protein
VQIFLCLIHVDICRQRCINPIERRSANTVTLPEKGNSIAAAPVPTSASASTDRNETVEEPRRDLASHRSGQAELDDVMISRM